VRIRRGDVIAGVDVLELRRYLKTRGDRVNYITAMETFSITKPSAEKFIADLVRLELIRKCESQVEKNITYYETTIAGNALGIAKAGKPVSRKSTERILREFLNRVRSVNKHRQLAYVVESVVVFGSYLSGKKQLNDLDIAVELKAREADDATQEKLRKESLAKAFESGRRFGNIVEELYWPEREVILILKNRSRTISLCEWRSLFKMPDLQYCVLIGDRKRIAGLIEHGKPVDLTTEFGE
jgi:predicted nucleotidyltransferase